MDSFNIVYTGIYTFMARTNAHTKLQVGHKMHTMPYYYVDLIIDIWKLLKMNNEINI